jgi:hypothetical protein
VTYFRGHTVLARLLQNVQRPVPKVTFLIQARWEGGNSAGTITSSYRYIGTQTASGHALSLYQNESGVVVARYVLLGTVSKQRTECSFLDMGSASDFIIQGCESDAAFVAMMKVARHM